MDQFFKKINTKTEIILFIEIDLYAVMRINTMNNN